MRYADRWRRAARLVLLGGVAVLVPACFGTESSVCPSGHLCPPGYLCHDVPGSELSLCLQTRDTHCSFEDPQVERPCPAGMVCDAERRLCLSPEQFHACAGRAEGAHCQLKGFAAQAPLECRRQTCVLPLCGDGVVDDDEACDDWNAVAGDGCSPGCTVEPGWACARGPVDPASRCTATCGDGVINGVESCDGSDLGGASCGLLGYSFGEVLCTAACAWDAGACSDAVEIPAGTFTMGSPSTEAGRDPDEGAHVVTLTRPFLLQTTEVTQHQFLTVMGYNPSVHAGCGPDCPVDNITWHEIALYLLRLSSAGGLAPCYECASPPSGSPRDVVCLPSPAFATPYDCPGYRLPTEAEWEHAARAGTTRATYGGDLSALRLSCEQPNPVLDPLAWFCGTSGYTTHPVARLQPNDWGVYDMLGNVWEWTQDGYELYPASAQTDPYVAPPGQLVVFRGASFDNRARYNRAANRGNGWPDTARNNVGARIARSVTP